MRYFSGLFAILPPFLGYAVGVCEIFLHKISVRVSPPGRCKVRVSRYSPPSFLMAPRAAVSSSSPDAPFMARKLPPTFTSGDMMYAMLLPSANDAASVLASDAAGGDLAAFAARMNARASQLGCTNTHFTCPHGLYDHNNYSTARDMAKIALACHANGTYMQVANTVSYTLPATNLHPARNISSTNRLLKPGSAYYRGYAQGMKTGFTTQAGRCFVTFASQNGRTYGLVILGSNSQNIFREAAELFDWAFSNPDLQPKAAAPETKKHSLFSFWQNLLG